MKTNWFKLLVLSLIFVSTQSACSGRAALKPGDIPAPPDKIAQSKVEATFGAVASNTSKEGSKLINSGPKWERVKKIVDKIAVAANLGSVYPYPIFVAENNDPKLVNAYVASGNIIVVYSNLIDRVSSDPELASVLGHEVGHMMAKHHEDDTGKERKSAVSIGSQILGTVAAVTVAVVTRSSASGRIVGGLTRDSTNYVGTGAFVKSYSREMESEADSIGLILMAKAGYDPRAAVAFWKKADQIFGHASKNSFMSTHPSHDDRAESLSDEVKVAMTFYKRGQQGALAMK